MATATKAILAGVLCAALGSACGGGHGTAPAASSSSNPAGGPRAADAGPSSRAPALLATMHDEAWRLVVRLDPEAPSGTLVLGAQAHALADVELRLEHEAALGSLPTDAGAAPIQVKRTYRLRFTIDACEHEPPTPPNRWPGLCGHPEGQPPPKRFEPYELLVDVTTTRWPGGEGHAVSACCVPASGAGPSCKLEGVAVAPGAPATPL